MSLFEEIHATLLIPNFAYAIARKNFYNGKWIKGCGWHPDYVTRLYHRGSTRFSEAKVHESLLVQEMKIVYFRASLHHTPYQNTADFLEKMQFYSTLFAEQHRNRCPSSIWKAFFHAFFTFLKSYFLKKGFLLGKEGFFISLYNSNTVFYKYVKLMEKNHPLFYAKEKGGFDR